MAATGRTEDRGNGSSEAAFCFGFGPWKFGFVRAYLAASGLSVRFCLGALDARLRGADRDSRIVIWGVRDVPSAEALAERLGVRVWRMEDGFLRSVGLGSDFHVPASLVLDRTGIYFDPNRPSDLETILQSTPFSDDELRRAAHLRERIVAAALSKYNFAPGTALVRPPRERVILVPGQVEDDASIRLGCSDIRTNEALLREVRTQHPDAFVIFKPHPDLLSGNRKHGRLGLERARALSDQVILHEPLPACLRLVDEVHTMTSLVGFEALLRGLRVHTYGRPFYSGWGLTVDRHTVQRRTRRLVLDELVAGTLLRYPLYLSRKTWQLTTPEEVVSELVEELQARPAPARDLAGATQVAQAQSRGARRVPWPLTSACAACCSCRGPMGHFSGALPTSSSSKASRSPRSTSTRAMRSSSAGRAPLLSADAPKSCRASSSD